MQCPYLEHCIIHDAVRREMKEIDIFFARHSYTVDYKVAKLLAEKGGAGNEDTERH